MKGWIRSTGAAFVQMIRVACGIELLKNHFDKRLNDYTLTLSANDMDIMNRLIELNQKIFNIEEQLNEKLLQLNEETLKMFDKRLNEKMLQLSTNDVAIMNKLIELNQNIMNIESDIAPLVGTIEKRSDS